MRVLTTSFAVLLVLVAFGPGVTTALGGDNETTVGSAGVASAPAVPPAPTPVSDRTFVPAPAPVPAQTLVPAPVPSPTGAGPVRDEFGNPNMIESSGMRENPGVPSNANVGVAVTQSGDQWRYRWHNNNWWYWTRENRWVFRNGNQWINYEPAATSTPDARYASQSAYNQPSTNGYYPSQYRYSTGYRGYYGPVYQDGNYGPVYQGGNYGPVYQGGYYYGPGGYYSQPGISVGAGFGRGLRIRF